MLNPYGAVIRVSQITLRTLDMRHYLTFDPARRMKQIKPLLVKLFLEMEKNTYHNELYVALGPDFSGPSVVMCGCRDCDSKLADLEHVRLSMELRNQQAEETARIVREVKARRAKRRVA